MLAPEPALVQVFVLVLKVEQPYPSLIRMQNQQMGLKTLVYLLWLVPYLLCFDPQVFAFDCCR